MLLNIKIVFSFLIFSLVLNQDIAAQTYIKKSEIIKSYGPKYVNGVTSDGVKYIKYQTIGNSDASGSYENVQVFYFKILPDGTEVCFIWIVINPSSEINNWVSIFNTRYVKVDKMLWKDYKYNMLYSIQLQEPFCTVKVQYDDM